MKLTEPHSVTAYTDTGIMFNCAIIFDCWQTSHIQHPGGVTTERFRKYRILCEIPWHHVNVTRFDIRGWPDDVTFTFDLPGMTEAEARQWASHRQIRELPHKEQ